MMNVNQQSNRSLSSAPPLDVVVVGGGVAGLAAALALTRARRSVLVVDAGHPRNAPAAHTHGYLTRDGASPLEMLSIGRHEVTGYGGQVIEGTVATIERREEGGFRVALADGTGWDARRVLVTTGLVDELSDIPGLRERWGRDVVHCPYCFGWELRDAPLGVLATGPHAVMQALMWRQWSADITLFLHTTPDPTEEQLEQLTARGVTLVHGEVAAIEVVADQLTGVRLRSGEVVERRAVVVGPRFEARHALLDSLGGVVTEHPFGIGHQVEADATGLASAGVWVAGNVADLAAGVMQSAASGVTAAAAINADLTAEDTRRAVATHQQSPMAPSETAAGHAHAEDMAAFHSQEFWDARYSSADALWSGNPNQRLVEQVADLAPGSALDVGSGEGADAIWLAARGWHVTGVDLSPVALKRAAKHAATAGEEVARRITWQQADVLSWDPAPEHFDLVSAHFLHLPPQARESLHRRLAAAVRPGGTLLIVAHHPSDLETSVRRPNRPELFWTAEEIAASLDSDDWEIIVVAAPERETLDPDGQPVTIRDAVLRAQRRG